MRKDQKQIVSPFVKQYCWLLFTYLHPLINAKKVEHEASLEVVDLKDNMETTITKWKHIYKGVMANS
jgi:hypothetical protein